MPSLSSLVRRVPRHLLLATSLLLAALAGLATAHRSPARETSDVYVWQRAWHPALRDALQQARDLTHAWHVLGAEATPDGALRPIAVDLKSLAATTRPVVLVIRIDGQLAGLDGAALVRGIMALHDRWQAGGLAVAGVEIDHDCGTAHLPDYALWLVDLRRALGPATPVSITALPAWLGSPALEQVLAEADESVLQVHAVRQPRAGLFDAEQAWRWTNAYARRTDHPFRVALPTYGSRVSFAADGTIADVESEAPTLAATVDRQELGVAPSEVARLLRRLRADPPPHLEGWAWFRLPTVEDRRAWRLATWRAVVQGRPLRAPVSLAWRAAAEPGAYDVVLENPGTLDAELPAAVPLPAQCALADGANGYAPAGAALRAPHPGLLPPGTRLIIGWTRCASPPNPSSVVLPDASSQASS